MANFKIYGSTKGLEVALKRVTPPPGNLVEAIVTCKATSGTLRTAHGSRQEHRSAGKNITIYRSQAKDGRDPVFFDSAELAKGTTFWVDAIKAGGDLGMAAKKVAEFMRRVIRKHVRMGRSVDGKMASVDRKRQYWKHRNYGRKPILVKTGQLLESLILDWKKL